MRHPFNKLKDDSASTKKVTAHQRRFKELLSASVNENNKQVDRFFTWMMVLQYFAGIAATLVISPQTWIAETGYVHFHVWFAVLFGAVLSGFPIFMARTFPGSNATMHVMAIAQAVWGALLIHFTGGRLETHFHVFCSLAFISFYRDWRPVITMTVVVASDHAFRGIVWPLSVYGIATESPWRWGEHACWVFLEDTVLVLSCLRGRREAEQVCYKQADLESLNASIEKTVEIRTNDLELARKKSDRLAMVAQHTDNSVLVLDAKGRVEWVNEGFTRQTGYSADEIIRKRPAELLGGRETDPESIARLAKAQTMGTEIDLEITKYREDGSRMILEIEGRPILDKSGKMVQYFQIERDITERKAGEYERERLHKRLRDAARAAGQADVAAGVLHNLGNVLNSTSVSVTLLRERLGQSATSQLSKASSILHEHRDNLAEFVTRDQRGKHLPRFLEQLSQSLEKERSLELAELDGLIESIDHIRNIVASQAGMAENRHVLEFVNLQDSIDSAIDVNELGFANDHVDIRCQVKDVRHVYADQHELIQILATLIKNAQEACISQLAHSHQVTIAATREGNLVAIDVTDTGIGIDAANLISIFQPGFTTKADGNGFGLHAAAITATELGGSLTAHSEGIGKGAVFRLMIPVEPTKESTRSSGQESTSTKRELSR